MIHFISQESYSKEPFATAVNFTGTAFVVGGGTLAVSAVALSVLTATGHGFLSSLKAVSVPVTVGLVSLSASAAGAALLAGGVVLFMAVARDR